MAARKARLFFTGLFRAATGRLNLCMGGIAATGALVLDSWLVLGLAAGSYAAAVVLDLRRPGLWKAVGKDLRGRGPSLPEPTELPDDDARVLAQRLARSREERERALAATAASYRSGEQVAAVIEAAAEVEKRATLLLATFARVAQYLSDKNITQARLQLEQAAARTTGARLPNCATPTACDRELACRAAEASVAALEGLAAHREALGARLAALVQGLEMLPHRILLAGLQEEDTAPLMPVSPVLDLEAELQRLEVSAAGAEAARQAAPFGPGPPPAVV